MNHIALVVEWYGPYSYSQAQVAARDFADGLYMTIGKTKHQKSPTALQYVGVASALANRICKQHHKIHEVTRDRKIWLGEIGSVGVPGRKGKAIDIRIDLAEWAHAYFLKLPLNDKKTKHAPDKPVTVLNRWWALITRPLGSDAPTLIGLILSSTRVQSMVRRSSGLVVVWKDGRKTT